MYVFVSICSNIPVASRRRRFLKLWHGYKGPKKWKN